MRPEVLIATEADLRAALALDLSTVGIVERAFAALAGEGVVMPPVLSMALPQANGEVDVKTAYLPGFDSFAIKVSPGFFDNPALGLPSLNGLMMLFSARTGLVEAVLLDNGYLTALRTAAAGAVAARHLAGQVETAGVLGSGAQARLQMRALHLVRPFRRCLVWGRDKAKARACAADIAQATGAEAEAVGTPAEVLAGAQAVVTTTPSEAPLVTADMLRPGLHLTAMGSDQPGKQELAAEVLVRADLYVADRVAQCAAMGELRAARAVGLMAEDPPELGAVVTGAHPGRQHAAEITIADLTGTGAQDTAIASAAFAALLAAGAGRRIAP